ncbi:MAG: response regulator transcription factor [Kordiimonadaceae bacterium]|jgi:DNA-binding response OmpR family regulator|nr:response regulator transcription factor [Kordiimonadaceae bacterium]MBT6036188.1 response regulator transcription factor [Kordiimonadaceae bacterium]MBT6329035.1 response regulator transcription factor [Kordiimonadaceae bacterium]MBT7581975.1 response regulator transcription factor [Kordiimonadaceae bacterium]
MTHTYNILLVDDDEELRENLALQLSFHEEFKSEQCGTGKSALDAVKEQDFELIVLDVGLPDIDGREVCRMMRRSGVSTPIVMLTANSSEADTILGLDAGANDYVTKPFKFGILLARIRAHLRQHLISEDASYPIGHYMFKPGEKILTNVETEEKIRLTEKETAILKYLKRAEGATISREKMLNEVWGYNSNVTTHTLETHIYRLRQKIEMEPSNAKIILTESGGYSMGIS